jgi:hypothetical protein
MHRLFSRLMTGAACVIVLGTATAVTAVASETPQNPTTGHKGAPGFNCAPGLTPGNAASAAGSAFNPSGNAGTRYAGNPGTASLANSNSTAAVSQYDNACR